MFTGSTKLPPTKTPQPERLDEVYAALRRGLQWVNTSPDLLKAMIPAHGWQLENNCKHRKWVIFACILFPVRSYLQVHQLELDSLGQQIKENKRNGRLVRAHTVRPVTPENYLHESSRPNFSVEVLTVKVIELILFVVTTGLTVWAG